MNKAFLVGYRVPCDTTACYLCRAGVRFSPSLLTPPCCGRRGILQHLRALRDPRTLLAMMTMMTQIHLHTHCVPHTSPETRAPRVSLPCAAAARTSKKVSNDIRRLPVLSFFY